jgi:cellulose synthase (UDP-forming)
MATAHSDNWGIPGLSLAVFALAFLALALAASTSLTTNSQIVLGWTLVAFAVYLRRHQGQVVALAIVAMSVVLGLRYFYWRIDSTLVQYWSASLVLGVALVCSELMVWLLAGLEYIGRIWPVEHQSDVLPEDAVLWPTVEIFLFATDATEDSIHRFIADTPQLNWPANKYRFTVLAARQEPSLTAACATAHIGIEYFSDIGSNDSTAMFSMALAKSEAELILFADCTTAIPSDFLRQTVGWFVSEQHLAMVSSPNGSLTPPPSDLVMRYLNERRLTSGNWTMVRRSAILGTAEVSKNFFTHNKHTALQLHQAGNFSAYLCFRAGAADGHEYTRLDEPFKPLSVWLRIHLHRLTEALAFYSPVAYAVFYVTPVAVLCSGAVPIATDILTLSAYWLPQWALGRLALATALEHHRLRWVDFVQEELRGVAVLLRTTKSFLKTKLARTYSTLKRSTKQPLRRPPAEVPFTHRFGHVFASIFFAAIGAYALYRWQDKSSAMLIELYIAWVVFLAMISVSAIAVQREQDWVNWARSSNSALRALLVPIDRTSSLTGITQNFPDLPLALNFSNPESAMAGRMAHLSIFHGHHESVFLCQVTQAQSGAIQVAIAPEQIGEYRQLASMVFSRSADWPMWLPPINADRLLPGWLAKLLRRAQDAFYNLTVKSAATAVIQRLRAWLKLGSPTNG